MMPAPRTLTRISATAATSSFAAATGSGCRQIAADHGDAVRAGARTARRRRPASMPPIATSGRTPAAARDSRRARAAPADRPCSRWRRPARTRRSRRRRPRLLDACAVAGRWRRSASSRRDPPGDGRPAGRPGPRWTPSAPAASATSTRSLTTTIAPSGRTAAITDSREREQRPRRRAPWRGPGSRRRRPRRARGSTDRSRSRRPGRRCGATRSTSTPSLPSPALPGSGSTVGAASAPSQPAAADSRVDVDDPSNSAPLGLTGPRSRAATPPKGAARDVDLED